MKIMENTIVLHTSDNEILDEEMLDNEISDDEISNFDWKLAVIAALVSVMVFARDLGFFSFTPIYFVIVFSVASIVLPYRSLQSLFFFWIPFGCALHGYVTIPLLIAIVLKSKQYNYFQLIFPGVILLTELLHLLSYSFSVNYIDYIVYGIYIFLFFFMLFDDRYDNASINQCIKYYIVGTAAVFFVILVHSIVQFGVAETIYGALRLGGDSGVFKNDENDKSIYASMNANTLAYYSVTAFALWLYTEDVFQRKAFKWLVFAMLMLAGILSSSRTWLIMMALTLVVYFFTATFRNKLGTVYVTIVLMIFAAQYNMITESFISRFSDRFEEENLETAGKRTELFAEYNSFLSDNPQYLPFGTGALYYRKICKIQFNMHNGIQQIYVCYGIMGMILYIICALWFYRRYKQEFRIVHWMPFFICLFFDQSLQFLNPYGLMLPFVATLLPVKLCDDDVSESD